MKQQVLETGIQTGKDTCIYINYTEIDLQKETKHSMTILYNMLDDLFASSRQSNCNILKDYINITKIIYRNFI